VVRRIKRRYAAFRSPPLRAVGVSRITKFKTAYLPHRSFPGGGADKLRRSQLNRIASGFLDALREGLQLPRSVSAARRKSPVNAGGQSAKKCFALNSIHCCLHWRLEDHGDLSQSTARTLQSDFKRRQRKVRARVSQDRVLGERSICECECANRRQNCCQWFSMSRLTQ
jgi:hypothetical protein